MNRRHLIIATHDAASTAVALGISFLLRWGWAEFAPREQPIAAACLVTLPVALASYWLFGLQRSPWKFTSLSDLNRLALAAAVPAVFLALVDFVSRGGLVVPRTVPVIYWFLQIVLLAWPRIAYRTYRNGRSERRAFKGAYRPPVLLVGADEEADGLITRLRLDAVSALEPVGILTAKPRQRGERIQDVPVLGDLADLDLVVERLAGKGSRPRRLVVTRSALEAPGIDDLLGAARRLGIAAVRPSQALTDVGAGRVELAPVSIDDLLGRSARDLDLAPVRAFVSGRRVAVTGAGGSIGSELCRQLAGLGAAELLLVDLSELALWSVGGELAAAHPGCPLVRRLASVSDGAELARAFAAFRPELVFHAAALKHVDLVEAHPVAAARTNTLGTDEVAHAARTAGVACAVFISTDKAVDPVSVLGATKRAGELLWALRDRDAGPGGTRFVTVRFGNVLGSSGSVIPLFAEQLRRGGPITITDPQVERYFMTISEAVRLVLTASALGLGSPDPSPAFVLDMGEPVKIMDLAHRMIRLAGLEPERDIAIAFTGLRPGERLSEILSSSGEDLRATAVAGIRSAAVAPGDVAAFEADLARLRSAVEAGDAPAALDTLSRLVPNYRRQVEEGPSGKPLPLRER